VTVVFHPLRDYFTRIRTTEYPHPLPQPHPPLQGGVCGLRNAGTNTRTPATSASSAFGYFAEVAEGKRSASTTVPNVPGLSTGASLCANRANRAIAHVAQLTTGKAEHSPPTVIHRQKYRHAGITRSLLRKPSGAG